MRRIKPWHVAATGIALALLALAVYAFWPSAASNTFEDVGVATADALPVEAFVARLDELVLTAKATGHLMPSREVVMYARQGGLLLERKVEEGDYVEKGKVLFVIENEQQQLNVAEAQAAFLKVQAAYTAQYTSEAARDTAQANIEAMLKQLQAEYEAGEHTPSSLEEAERTLVDAQMRAGALRGEVRRATMGLTQAWIQLQRARRALSETYVRAPFDGWMADIQVDAGEYIQVGKALASLVDLDPIHVAADVLEEDLFRLDARRPARVRIPALAQHGDNTRADFSATVAGINPTMSKETGAGRVTLEVANEQALLRGGQYVEVELSIGRIDETLVVPADALLMRQGRELVFVVKQGRAVWTYVAAGARNDLYVQILDGLSLGDTVAVAGHHTLADDTPVAVKKMRDP